MLNPIIAPSVIATNPPDKAVAVLPLGVISVTFDRDMLVAGTTDSRSVTNPQNYDLAGDPAHQVTIQQVLYDASSRTAFLILDGLTADHYTLTVKNTIHSVADVALTHDYTTGFTAVGDLAGLVSFTFLRAPAATGRRRPCRGMSRSPTTAPSASRCRSSFRSIRRPVIPASRSMRRAARPTGDG